MSLSPEWDLVLSGARAALRPGAEETTAPAPTRGLPNGSGSWRRAASIACQNRLGPLAYFGLRRLPLPEEARPALEILHQAYVATAARNALLFRSLSSLLTALSAGGIPVLVLKGAALAETVYPERALRPMADIDLLVRAEDLERAESRLRTVGYEVAHDPETKAELRARHHHWLFRSARADAGGIRVEVHWDLDPPGGPVAWNIPVLFERAERAPLGGIDALVLSPEDSLLHVCIHLCRHRFNGGVIALCDIAAGISRNGGRIDWRRFERRARELGASAYAFVPLRLAADLMGAKVPPAVLARLQALDAGDRLFELARERILEEKGDVRGAAELRLRWRRRSLRRRWAAARQILSHESPARDGREPVEAGGARPWRSDLARRYAPWLWALLRHPRLVSAAVRREEGKSELDSWCAAGFPRREASRPPS